ncbi:MAG: hypothetical protein UX28_C0003G0114 [Candidatus Pacebacteria bacterium GW2011_GWA1_46_10]|nr:MAG: hypothetical protein UX28_C0003G0114 [Candidatus Pacebacteria bacterium GW2011_GWA1_46_10]
MKKIIHYDQKAKKEFLKLPNSVQKYFNFAFDVLRKTGKLDFPLGRRL